jgi:hypothetical protein
MLRFYSFKSSERDKRKRQKKLIIIVTTTPLIYATALDKK